MPIVDIELVAISERALSQILVNSLADSLGKVFGSQPGRTWVRLRFLSREAYAENETNLSIDQLPVFVTVLHAHPSKGAALMTEVNAITFALASLPRPRFGARPCAVRACRRGASGVRWKVGSIVWRNFPDRAARSIYCANRNNIRPNRPFHMG